MSKKAVVLGAGGQLGGELVRVFRERGYEVTGFDRKGLDICNYPDVENVLGGLNPTVVLNSAAYNQVDVAESDPHAAFMGNALSVRNLAVVCRQLDSLLVHFSTDYVFDGTLGRAYTEEDQTHPIGAYAVSKLAGELYAQAYLHPLIIRTSGVFGPGGLNTARGNFVELMLRLASSGNPIRVVEDFVASPTYAPALAERSADLVDRELRGVYHVGGGTPISWFEYAALIFEVFGVHPELRATDEREYRTPARRPKYSALSNAKMEAHGIRPMPSLREALEDYRRRREAMVGPLGKG
jgi:dTDP-4-dehydrorhamnose reductase